MSVDTDLISRAHLSLQSLSDEAERLEYKMHMQQRRISERAEYERATSERRATLTPSGAAREVREEMEVLNRSLHEQLSSMLLMDRCHDRPTSTTRIASAKWAAVMVRAMARAAAAASAVAQCSL